jgi:hypothetical protein
MNDGDLNTFAEVVWLLNNTPQPVGFNRKPLTFKQRKIVEEMVNLISYPENYSALLNSHNGQ